MRIQNLFAKKKNGILSIYFTAGFPELNDTVVIIEQLQSCGVDMIEIGIPFSDPLADGAVIQHSSQVALTNGMTLKLLFEQLRDIRKSVDIPLLLMGYLNPILQYGMDKFCEEVNRIGIDGVIIPDLPLNEYLSNYKDLFVNHKIANIFLITPQTSADRIRLIDQHSNGFIYMVSSSSTTGTRTGIDEEKEKYFDRIRKMNLSKPLMIGFGISERRDFLKASQYTSGAIIGSAFIRELEKGGSLKDNIASFIRSIGN